MTLSINLIAQEELGWVWSVELYLGIEGNVPQPNSFTLYLDHVGTVWASEDGCTTQYFINTDPDINNSNYPWTFDSLEYFRWRGWDCVYSQNTNIPPISAPIFGYGLYKVSTNIPNSAYFYIDYRDTRIPYVEYPRIGDPIDFWIKYDYDNNTFWYSPSPGIPPGYFTQISSGEYLKIWEQKMQYPSPPITAGFPDYWENCLAVIPSIDNHPLLVWGPYPETATDFYKIYRKDSYGGGWQYLAQTTNTYYEDETLTYCPPKQICPDQRNFYFRVTAIDYNLHESDPSNEVAAKLVGDPPPPKISMNNSNTGIILENSLDQNYPNPFNPTTQVNYLIKSTGLVSLKVYDILGREVAELVNERKELGNYSVTFDASGLSSGLYFYQLNTGGYSVTKKMLVQK